jgi:hypothetical protein
VNIPEVIEKDDSSNTSNIPGHEDISIQEVPLTMAPSATANILESAAHFQGNDLNVLPQIDTVVSEVRMHSLPSFLFIYSLIYPYVFIFIFVCIYIYIYTYICEYKTYIYTMMVIYTCE